MATFVDYILKHTKMTHSDLVDRLSLGMANYKVHSQRRGGKKREVYEPNAFLRDLQMQAVKVVFSKYRVSSCATAYEPQSSVLKNAKIHQNSKFLAKYDIKNFYGSIRFWHFEKLLATRYDRQDIKLLWMICSLNDSLPVGAYSSSFIANRVMLDFDNAIKDKFFGVKYSRYADDMCFSSNSELPQLTKDLVWELGLIKLELNEKKTHTYNDKTPKRVAGVTITANNQLTVGKKYKLSIKKRLYDFIHKGKGNRQKIIGRLNYIKFIEPAYYQRLVEKYNLNSNLFLHSQGEKSGNLGGTVSSIKMPNVVSPRHYGVKAASSNRARAGSNSGMRGLAIILAIIMFLLGMVIGINIANARNTSNVIDGEIEFNVDNYTKYIEIRRGYGSSYESTSFVIHIHNISGYLIKDLIIDFFVVDGSSIIYMDTIYYESVGGVPKQMEYNLNKQYSNFANFSFQYPDVRGLVTTIPN